MQSLKLMSNRLIKFIGNILKISSYGFHKLFPNKRFTIPNQSNPWIKSNKESKVPKIIWQTNYTGKLTIPLYLNYLCNRLMAPKFEYRFMVTEDRESYIKENYPEEILEAYNRLNVGAAQADYWRMLVLYKEGGVYIDIDAHLVWGLSSLVKPNMKNLYIKVKSRDHYTNYFIATEKNSPIIKRAIDIITDNIQQEIIKGVYSLTGPETLNLALEGYDVNNDLYRYVAIQGSFSNEHFQYIDKKQGKWTHVKPEHVLKKKPPSL